MILQSVLQKHNIKKMSKNKTTIEDSFVRQLFGHSTFQRQLWRYIKKGQSVSSQPTSVPALMDQICDLLTENYRQTIDQESVTMYQTCTTLTKELDCVKTRLATLESGKPQVSFEREKNPEMSMFSSMSFVQGQKRKSTAPIDEKMFAPRQCSFIGSLLNDTGYLILKLRARDLREEIEEKLKSSRMNLMEDLSKIQTRVAQRLKLLENGVNKKMENIFKTLESLFETINEIQLKNIEDEPKSSVPSVTSVPQAPSAKNKLQQLLEYRPQYQPQPPKERHEKMEQKNMTDGTVPRKRSFMGFKY